MLPVRQIFSKDFNTLFREDFRKIHLDFTISMQETLDELNEALATTVLVSKEEVTILDVTIQWPSVLTDVSMLYKMYLDGDGGEYVEPYHEMLTSFRKFLETVQVQERG